jgi:hypothetical protein
VEYEKDYQVLGLDPDRDQEKIKQLRSCTAKEKELAERLVMCHKEEDVKKDFRPKELTDVIMDPRKFRDMIKKEAAHFHKDKRGKELVPNQWYRDVWLLETTNRFIWMNSTRDWFHMVLKFYFPNRYEIRHVLISNCIECFTKPQICNIVSWAKYWAV